MEKRHVSVLYLTIQVPPNRRNNKKLNSIDIKHVVPHHINIYLVPNMRQSLNILYFDVSCSIFHKS